MSDPQSIQLFFTPDFQSQLRKLAKRYRSIQDDLQPLLRELQSNNFPGEQIPGTTYTIFKVRLKNSDIQKGKSGGYRVIYQWRENACILLVVIYSKSDQSNFPVDQIREIITTFNQ
jgi:mRNA-degrading endonuclease RelE of RelBE toxin-antitoxin system